MTENTTPTSAEAARRYIELGFAAIPVPAGSKNPNRPEWQKERWGVEDIPEQWSNGQGIGLLVGEPSGGLVAVDPDRPEACKVARHLLPKTRTSGREGSPVSKWWYHCAPTPKTKRFELAGDGGDQMVVELL